MKTPRPFQPVIITWEDAEGDGSSAYDSPRAALDAYVPRLRKAIGFWIGWGERDGRRAAIIATDDDRRRGSKALAGISQIPLGMIIDIVPVAPTSKKP